MGKSATLSVQKPNRTVNRLDAVPNDMKKEMTRNGEGGVIYQVPLLLAGPFWSKLALMDLIKTYQSTFNL